MSNVSTPTGHLLLTQNRILIFWSKLFKRRENWSSRCGAAGSAASVQGQDASSIPYLAQWVKDLTLLQLWHRWLLRLSSDAWPSNSICQGAAKKEKGGKKGRETFFHYRYPMGGSQPWVLSWAVVTHSVVGMLASLSSVTVEGTKPVCWEELFRGTWYPTLRSLD